ncbi:MAG TPA: hypothetical protein VGE07_07520 [Herpetosiphonaceae bacterium]
MTVILSGGAAGAPDLRLRADWEAGTEWINRLAWSPDGRCLASAGDDGRLRLWRMPDGAPLLAIDAHRGEIQGLAWSQGGRWLASSSDGLIRIWELRC